jgi:hypothetical protein
MPGCKCLLVVTCLQFGSHDHVDEPIYLLFLVDALNIQLVYLANLATMILINLLYRRFDNLLRTISEIVTRGIVLAIRERERHLSKNLKNSRPNPR